MPPGKYTNPDARWAKPAGEAELAGAIGWGETDLNAAKCEAEMAVIALRYNGSAGVVEVAASHLEKALQALRPERTNTKSIGGTSSETVG